MYDGVFIFNKTLPASIKQFNKHPTPHTLELVVFKKSQEFCEVALYSVWTGTTRVSFHGVVGVKIIQLVAAQCTVPE